MSNATAAPSPTTGTVAVSMQGIEKAFGANRVLQGVDFEVLAGEVHTLAGENGAGKSTLMKILQGVYSADAGDIAVDGHSVTINSPIAAREAGVGTGTLIPIEGLTDDQLADGETYLTVMAANRDALAEALGCA